MQKKDLEVFRGKRILSSVPNAPGISRAFTWSESKRKYEPPKSGKIYCARRYIYEQGKKKREFEYFATLDDARNWQGKSDKPAQSTSTSTIENRVKKSPTIETVLQKWRIDSWPSLALNTVIQYKKCSDTFKSILHMEIESIKPSDIDDLIAEWKKNYVKSSIRTSFEKEFQTLKVLFRWYQNNYDDAAIILPFKKRHSEQIRVKAKKNTAKKYMTDDETTLFLSHLRKDSYLFYVLAFVQLKQMLRISEVTAMKWRNLNVTEKVYDLCEHITWPRIKDMLSEVTPGTKNLRAGSIYTLNLFTEVAELISTLPTKKGCDLIFHVDGEMLTYRQVQYRYDKAFAAAGLPYRSTHVLRHTGATSFYNETGDLLALQQMGTWSDVRMPQHYAKVKSSRAQNAIRELESKRKKVKINNRD
ncbi:tyrosine-type recombinase/integrase [Bdellovibrio bacteriovorus]|uniref:tyrosine-type recombinase/integrase n=1 Tax=Bdellovibrio bacteriovorus TaxID=959 RepID=UPI0035A72DBE